MNGRREGRKKLKNKGWGEGDDQFSVDFILALHTTRLFIYLFSFLLPQLKDKSLGAAQFCIKPMVRGHLPLKVVLRTSRRPDVLHKHIVIKVLTQLHVAY